MSKNFINGKPYLQSHNIKINFYIKNYIDSQILLDWLTREIETLGVANSLSFEGYQISLL